MCRRCAVFFCGREIWKAVRWGSLRRLRALRSVEHFALFVLCPPNSIPRLGLRGISDEMVTLSRQQRKRSLLSDVRSNVAQRSSRIMSKRRRIHSGVLGRLGSKRDESVTHHFNKQARRESGTETLRKTFPGISACTSSPRDIRLSV